MRALVSLRLLLCVERESLTLCIAAGPSQRGGSSATVNFMAHGFLIISTETEKSNMIRSVKGS